MDDASTIHFVSDGVGASDTNGGGGLLTAGSIAKGSDPTAEQYAGYSASDGTPLVISTVAIFTFEGGAAGDDDRISNLVNVPDCVGLYVYLQHADFGVQRVLITARSSTTIDTETFGTHFSNETDVVCRIGGAFATLDSACDNVPDAVEDSDRDIYTDNNEVAPALSPNINGVVADNAHVNIIGYDFANAVRTEVVLGANTLNATVATFSANHNVHFDHVSFENSSSSYTINGTGGLSIGMTFTNGYARNYGSNARALVGIFDACSLIDFKCTGKNTPYQQSAGSGVNVMVNCNLEHDAPVDNAGQNVRLDGGSLILVDGILTTNKPDPSSATSRGLTTGTGTRAWLVGCTSYGHRSNGIAGPGCTVAVNASTSMATIINSVLIPADKTNDTGVWIRSDNGGSLALVYNTAVYSVEDDSVMDYPFVKFATGAGPPDSGNEIVPTKQNLLEVDPLFVDTTDFEPSYGSPLIEAGIGGHVIGAVDRALDYPDKTKVHTSDTSDGQTGTLTLPANGQKTLTSESAFGVGGSSITPSATLPLANTVLYTAGDYGEGGNSHDPSYTPDFPDKKYVHTSTTVNGEDGTLSLPADGDGILETVPDFGIVGEMIEGKYHPTETTEVVAGVAFGADSAEVGVYSVLPDATLTDLEVDII